MVERRVHLVVFRVARVARVRNRNAGRRKLRLVQVYLRRRSRQIFGRAGLPADAQQTSGSIAFHRIVHRPRQTRADSQHSAESGNETVVHGAQLVGIGFAKQTLELGFVAAEKRGARVARADAAPVLPGPAAIGNTRVANPLLEPALDLDGNRQPDRTIRGLDAIPIAPVALRILHVVEQHELIDRGDEIEVTLPRYVAGLNDRDALGHVWRRFYAQDP